MSVVRTDSQFDVALVFSTKYESHSVLDHWQVWQQWKARYFGFHRDLPPEIASTVLGGKLTYLERRKGQWVAIILMEKIERARQALPDELRRSIRVAPI